MFVTSVPYAAELVTRMYVGRADSENRIKELKEDLSLDTFCLQSFDATDAAFRTGCVLYNLLMGFRETVLPSCWFERRLRVRFAVPTEERAEFLQRLRTLSAGLPIAAQLDWDLSEDADNPPPPPERTDTPYWLRARRAWHHLSCRLHQSGLTPRTGSPIHSCRPWCFPMMVNQLRNPG